MEHKYARKILLPLDGKKRREKLLTSPFRFVYQPEFVCVPGCIYVRVCDSYVWKLDLSLKDFQKGDCRGPLRALWGQVFKVPLFPIGNREKVFFEGYTRFGNVGEKGGGAEPITRRVARLS